MEQFIVYCPQAGYEYFPTNTGAPFAREERATRFERELRAVGLVAWTERRDPTSDVEART